MDSYLLDTSSLIADPDICSKLNGQVFIPSVVLEELDKLKQENYNARQVIRNLKNSSVNYIIDDCIDINLPPEFDKNKNDNKILWLALKNNYILVTNDLVLQQKAKSLNIVCRQIEDKRDNYTGYKIIEIDETSDKDNKLLASFYENPTENTLKLYINQYLIIKNKCDKTTIDIFRWSGNELEKLKLPPKKIIAPLNDFQACALDLLHNKNIPIKFIIGEMGSGKTYLATRLGFYYTFDKGLYNKVFVCRNPIGAGENIGALPGDKFDKIGEFYLPIKQNANISNIDRLIDCDQLEFNVPFFIKGNTYDDTWIIVDESEDFDIKTLRLIGGRIGKNSCITFCGDYLQAEKKFEKNNGLKYAVNKLKGNPLVGVVFLKENVRSDSSNVFLKL